MEDELDTSPTPPVLTPSSTPHQEREDTPRTSRGPSPQRSSPSFPLQTGLTAASTTGHFSGQLGVRASGHSLSPLRRAEELQVGGHGSDFIDTTSDRNHTVAPGETSSDFAGTSRVGDGIPGGPLEQGAHFQGSRADLQEVRLQQHNHDNRASNDDKISPEGDGARLRYLRDKEERKLQVEEGRPCEASSIRSPGSSCSSVEDAENGALQSPSKEPSPGTSTASAGATHAECPAAPRSNGLPLRRNDHMVHVPVCLKRKLFTIDSIIGSGSLSDDQGLDSRRALSGDETCGVGRKEHAESEPKKRRDIFDQIPSPPPKITDIEKLKARELSYMTYPYGCNPASYAYLSRQVVGQVSPSAYAASLAAVKEGVHPSLVPMAGAGPYYHLAGSPLPAPAAAGPHPYALSPGSYLSPGPAPLTAYHHHQLGSSPILRAPAVEIAPSHSKTGSVVKMESRELIEARDLHHK